VHDHAETGANTRLPASDLVRGLTAFTSRTLNEMRQLPPFVRNAEVGSSSLLPSIRLAGFASSLMASHSIRWLRLLAHGKPWLRICAREGERL
jgi:hypothetical protein